MSVSPRSGLAKDSGASVNPKGFRLPLAGIVTPRAIRQRHPRRWGELSMIQSEQQARWRVASPHHRKFRVDRLNLIGLSLRVTAGALLSAVVWIHLHLW